MGYYPVHQLRIMAADQAACFTVTARLAHVIRYIPRPQGGGMATRTITIVFDENLTDEQYADHGNGIWAVLKIAHPKGGFHLESDGGTTVKYLNDRRPGHGSQCPWR
jgi:ABC-type tungstate transport system permease subunit